MPCRTVSATGSKLIKTYLNLTTLEIFKLTNVCLKEGKKNLSKKLLLISFQKFKHLLTFYFRNKYNKFLYALNTLNDFYTYKNDKILTSF